MVLEFQEAVYCNLHGIMMHGEGPSANTATTTRFALELQKFISDAGYLPEQVFNANETGIFL